MDNNQQPEQTPTPAPYAAGTGSVPIGVSADALARMSYRERLAFKRSDPEGYARAKQKD